jgi:O-antigen/teichoic acid export membrane protein
MVPADRFVVASFVATSLLAFYTVPQDFVLRLLVIPAAIATAWFPRIALINASESKLSLRPLLARGYKITGWVMGPLCLLLMFGSKQLLGIWLRPEFADGAWQVSIVLLLGIFFNAMAHIPLAALQATGHVKQTALLHVFELVLFIPILWYVLPTWGIMGAAIVWTMRTLMDLLFLFGLNQYYLNEDTKLRG